MKSQNTKLITKTAVEGRVQFVAKTCACLRISPSISEIIEENNCLGVLPVMYTGGWEHHRVIGFYDQDMRAILKRLGKIGKAEVVYKKEVHQGAIHNNFAISLGSLLGDLTNRQTEALSTALQSGYYAVPKRVTTGELARRQKVPRTV